MEEKYIYSKNSSLDWGLFFLAVAFFAYTQVYAIFDVPGPHYDEAWQGLFADRIAREPDFWPLHAMNAYTVPVLHYILAFAFKVFGSSFEVSRVFFCSLQFLTASLLCALVHFKSRSVRAMFFFLFLWALLPLHVFDRRFMIEVTAWHPLCATALLWGAALWRVKPRLAFSLLVSALILGIYSHIFFIAFALAFLAVLIIHNGEILKEKRSLQALTCVAALTVPFLFGAYESTRKITALLLLITFSSLFILSLRPFYFFKLCTLAKKFGVILEIPAAILALGFLVLHYSGVWAMHQHLGPFTQALPLLFGSLVIFTLIGNLHSFSGRLLSRKGFSSPMWNLFLWNLFFTCIFTPKLGPRFFILPSLFFSLHLTLLWNEKKASRVTQVALAVFIVFFAAFFQTNYIGVHQRFGGSNEEVRFFAMRDSSRDFRPFHRAFQWAVDQGCQETLTWFEDDRFALPVQFLKLRSRSESQKKCPWKSNELFFSHTPTPFPDLVLLQHKKEWGDLAFWLRKKED